MLFTIRWLWLCSGSGASSSSSTCTCTCSCTCWLRLGFGFGFILCATSPVPTARRFRLWLRFRLCLCCLGLSATPLQRRAAGCPQHVPARISALAERGGVLPVPVWPVQRQPVSTLPGLPRRQVLICGRLQVPGLRAWLLRSQPRPGPVLRVRAGSVQPQPWRHQRGLMPAMPAWLPLPVGHDTRAHQVWRARARGWSWQHGVRGVSGAVQGQREEDVLLANRCVLPHRDHHRGRHRGCGHLRVPPNRVHSRAPLVGGRV
mmetsp:Transcript_29453/g.96133  ORF Transcript_29453/g.96133 Transcript_29453/m.96133 type:complete len:260 (-) Transcript_29453:170-949(-)